MGSVSLEKHKDGAALILFDTPDSPVNVLSRELLGELAGILDEIESDDSVRACVLASGKPSTFIAGADIGELLEVAGPEEGEALSRSCHRLLDRIAGSRKPFVAAIGGAALGGGLEVALACRYRLAADDPATVLALPEVTLGLLPGGGGTQRLPRLIGLANALPLMLTGKRLHARKALNLGLVDELVPGGGIDEEAAASALALAEGKLRSRSRRPLPGRLLEALVRGFVFRTARAGILAKTRGLYPAPLSILECVETGYTRGIREGMETESVLFGRLAAGPESKCLIGLFQAMRQLKKPGDVVKPGAVRRLGILGGGFMGSGIASVSLPHVPVVVKDLSDKVLARCAKEVEERLGRQVRSGAIRAAERDRRMEHLTLSATDDDLAGSDLIIEAVFEELDLKRKVLQDLESRVSSTAVIASNTSALPISSIAERASHPERVLGMHYFSPVPKMPLLEIVAADRTADWAVATARAFGILQGKTVIVVKDGPGFYTSRILSPFLGEAMILLEEGARVEEVDRAVKDSGFPVGPLTLLDEVGIDVAAHVTKNVGQLYAHRGLESSDALPRLYEAGYTGRKSRRGFYRYEDKKKKKRKRKKQVEPRIYDFFGGPRRKAIASEETGRRFTFLMINEAVYCLQEGVIACPRDGDVGAVLGLGFPAFRGGPFRYLDSLGAAAAVETMEQLRKSHGPRFEPAPMLQDMARDGKRFYPDEP